MIDDGQRDHSLPLSLHVLKHVLVVDHLQGGVQLGLNTGLLDEWTSGQFDNMTSILDRKTLTCDNKTSISDI